MRFIDAAPERLESIAGIKNYLRQSFAFTGVPPEAIRARQEEALDGLPMLENITVKEVDACGLRAEWVVAPGVEVTTGPAVLYYHGGAFIAGSCRTHRDLAARISQAACVRVLVFEYRLAPEHPHPAAAEDSIAVFRWLLDQGLPPEQVVFGGDSVGGTLALMTLLSLRDAGEEGPAGAFLLSPHTDFIYFDSPTYASRAGLDPMGSLASSRLCADYYAGRVEPKPPALSPVNCKLGGLPPLFIQAGDHEVLLGECCSLAERAEAAGVQVELEVWGEMWCAFQLLAGAVPEAGEAIGHVGRFVRSRIGTADLWASAEGARSAPGAAEGGIPL